MAAKQEGAAPTLEQRVDKLERWLKVAQVIAGVLGLSLIVLLGFVWDAQEEAAEAQNKLSSVTTAAADLDGKLKGSLTQLNSEARKAVAVATAVALEEITDTRVSPLVGPGQRTIPANARFCSIIAIDSGLGGARQQTNANCRIEYFPRTRTWELSSQRDSRHTNLKCQMACFGMKSSDQIELRK